MRDGEKFRLGDLCSITKGETPIKQAIPGPYPLVVTAAERASHESFQFDCRAVIVPLVSSTGHGHASIKRINYQEGKFALGSILCAVVPNDEKRLSAKFLHVYFSYFKDQLIVPLMKGSANVSLSVGALAELKIIVPPMEVQQRVIRLAENDALIKPLEQEITHQETLLAKLKQAILQEAIAGKLTADWRAANPEVEPASQLLRSIQVKKTRLVAAKKMRPEKHLPKITPEEIPFEIPEGWEWCRLLDLCEKTGSGSTPSGGKSAYSSTGIPFLRSQNVHNEGLILEDVAYISKNIHTRMEGTTVYPDDLLLNITGGSIGRCALVTNEIQEANVNQHVAIVRPVLRSANSFMHAVILSPYFQGKIDAAQTGAGREGLPKNKMDRLLIPLPPLDEQAEIVERVGVLMEHCQALATEITLTRTHAAQLLQAVIKEAFAPAATDD